jgi:hypothetical protein
MNQVKLTPGQALVIAGSRRSGKTALAREVAERAGTYSEIEGADFDTPFGLAHAMRSQPATLIVEGLPETTRGYSLVKHAISNETFELNAKGEAPRQVRTPNLIFCTGWADAVRVDAADRRFHVVKLADDE